MPVVHLLAGPNGSGKSSYARDVLIPTTRLPFINADEIAADLWPTSQSDHAYEAAQIAERNRREHLAAGGSFISETVFSHASKVQLVADAAQAGFMVHLHVMMVPVELTVQRVTERVRRGGHAVPEEKIRQRYERLWAHLAEAVALADVAEFFDNSSARHPFRWCATYQHGMSVGAPRWPQWAPAAVTGGVRGNGPH